MGILKSLKIEAIFGCELNATLEVSKKKIHFWSLGQCDHTFVFYISVGMRVMNIARMLA